jgi:hypothetical protein
VGEFPTCSDYDEYLHCAKLGIGAITGLKKTLGEDTEKPQIAKSIDALLGTFADRLRESLSATS